MANNTTTLEPNSTTFSSTFATTDLNTTFVTNSTSTTTAFNTTFVTNLTSAMTSSLGSSSSISSSISTIFKTSHDTMTSTLPQTTTTENPDYYVDLAWIIPTIIVVVVILTGLTILFVYCIQGIELWFLKKCRRYCSCCEVVINNKALGDEYQQLTGDSTSSNSTTGSYRLRGYNSSIDDRHFDL